MGIQLHLCGRIAITCNDQTIDEPELPGRQGRLALVLLGVERRRPVSTDRLIGALWDQSPPPDPGGSIASIVSKLRALLRRGGCAGPDVITSVGGTYQLRLPAGSAIDLEIARKAIDQAEGARRYEREGEAWAHAAVAVSIARRGFLPGESADWVWAIQQELDRIARRAYDCLTWAWTVRGDGVLASAMAELAVATEPLHEPAWRTLMLTHARFGSRADAVRVYQRCCERLAEELGVPPDAETARLYDQLLSD